MSPLSSWHKAKIVGPLIATIVIPIVVVYVGNLYTSASRDRETQGKFVEMAIGILRSTQNDSATGLRQWAADIVDRYSGVPLPNKARQELIEGKPLPLYTKPLIIGGMSKEDALIVAESYRTEDGAKNVQIFQDIDGKFTVIAYFP